MHMKHTTLILTIVKKSITITVAGADSARKLKKKKKKKSSIKIMPNLLILEEKQIMHKQFKRSGSWDVEIT